MNISVYIKLGFFAILLLFFSCDKIEKPYTEVSNNPIDTGSGDTNTINYVQKVVVEDYTGHRCGNCPRAHEELHTLMDTYGDRIIPIALHVGYFAQPTGAPYNADYRTSAGDEYDNYFGPSNVGLPQGMVNRIEVGGSPILAYADWGTYVNIELNKEPLYGIIIDNSFDSGSRDLSTNIKTSAIYDTNMTVNLKLVVLLTEDSIVSAQTDYSLSRGTITDYEHNHMLRGGFNTAWGEELYSGTVIKGDTASKTYSMNLDANFNENKCNVVAFIYDDDATYKTILQAEQKAVITND